MTGPAKNLFAFFKTAAHIAGHLLIFLRDGQMALDPAFVEAARQAGLPMTVIRERRRFDPVAFAELGAVCDVLLPDIVQTHSVKSHALARLLGKSRGRSWVAFHHGYTTTDLRMRAYNAVDRWSLRGADLVVTTSKPFAAELADRIGAIPIHVLHNAVTADDLALGHAGSRSGRGLHVLSVGRLSREKGHDDLLRAIAYARAGGAPDLHVTIAGDGPERVRLERLARTLRIQEYVRMIGHVLHPRDWYARADLFALASHSEGSPNALLEAMAAGLPVIATAVGGVSEILEHRRTGMLLPARRPRLLADAVLELAKDRALCERIAAAGRAHVAAHHGIVARTRALLRLYATVATSTSWARNKKVA